MTYTPFTLHDVDSLLSPLGFIPVTVPNTQEIVYAKRVDITGAIPAIPLSLRIYTSVVGTTSRDNGKDAIRVALVTRNSDGDIKWVGGSKRVNRTDGWQNRLEDRIHQWESMIGPACPRCGSLMRERNGNRGKFWGCSTYPTCKGTVNPTT